jgi:hypothetical protein
MKSSTKILIGVLIAISFIVGFFIGITVDYPKTNKGALSGTIGRMSNYRDVKVTDKDIQLRSDLMTSEAFLKSYRQFYSFNYSSCVKLCDDIDFAIQAAEAIPQFKESYSSAIENLKEYRQTLEQSRLDLLLASSTLQKLKEIDVADLTQIINDANIAITQVKFKENYLLAFVESIEKFIQGNNPNQYSDLIKAHDRFAINQIITAALTNDKPMLKAYNNKKVISSYEDLKLYCSTEQINSALQSDFKSLQSALKDNSQLNIYNAALVGIIGGQCMELVPAIEKIGVIVCVTSEGSGCVGSHTLGTIDNTEKLGLILNTDKLGTIMNSEKLGVFMSSDKLGVCNLEKLGACNVEKLNIE